MLQKVTILKILDLQCLDHLTEKGNNNTYKTLPGMTYIYLQDLLTRTFFTPRIQYTHEKSKKIIKDQGKQDSTGCL